MKKYTVIADPQVKNDLKEARDFLNSRRKGYGKIFLTEYKQTLKSIQNNPLFQIRYKNVHFLPLKNFKYMIHFKVDETKKTVHIYGVLSTYLDPNDHWL